jgi:aminoglycoside phosphotransferase (APT) family kinase protein
MEKLPGLQLDEMELSEAEKADSAAEMVKMAAQLHKVKNDKFGYIQSGLYDDWYKAIRAIVESMIADCGKKGRKTKRGEKLLSYIDRYQAVLAKAECCMVNFDIWAPNIICRRENGELKYAWIDPERCFWGDRIVDFVCFEFMNPLADKKASLAAYNSVADKPVAATEDEKIRYAVALGYLALIMEVEKYFRYSPRHFGWRRNSMASAMLYKTAFDVLKNG